MDEITVKVPIKDVIDAFLYIQDEADALQFLELAKCYNLLNDNGLAILQKFNETYLEI